MNDAPERVVVTLDFCARPTTPVLARRIVQTVADAVSFTKADDAALVVSELVTNAVRHGSPDSDGRVVLEVTAERERLSGCVRDHGPPFEIPGPGLPPDRAGQFGLQIAIALATTLEVDREVLGNVMRFELGAARVTP